jgi:Baseplate hub gp41
VGFVQRLIQVSVTLAQNTQTNQPTNFAESGTPQVNLTGSRVSVKIENSGAPVDGRATVKIWGMTPSLMNQLSTLGLVYNLVPKNTLTIQAGDAVSGMSTVFSGTIWQAYGDYSAQPDVPFIFECLAGAADATISVPASSFPGSTDVGNMMSGFARQMNLGFENNGVSVNLSNAYFSGSARVQADKCARAAGISWGIINGNTLAIWPKGGNRNTSNVPVISAETGMISYPAFTQQGIIVRTLFNPQIAFGGLVQVKSTLLSAIAAAQPTQANATGNAPSTFPTQWAINKLDLALDSLVPKGHWMSTVFAYNPNYARAIIPPSS